MKTAILTVVLLMVAAAAIVAWFTWRFSASMGADVDRLVAESKPPDDVVVTQAMLAALPPPAQRYFRYAGVVGTRIPTVVRVAQLGRIRGSAQSGWMDLEAEETYATNPPGFVWRAWFPRRLAPFVLGRDEYLDGKGSIVMKAGGLYPVAEDRSEALGAAGLMRYLNEMMWFPASYFGSNVAIGPVDDSSFSVTITDRGMTATGMMFIDGEGRPTNFRALRYNTATQKIETWETPLTAYGERAGLHLPVAGKAVWKLASGDFEYIALDIGDVVYDP